MYKHLYLFPPHMSGREQQYVRCFRQQLDRAQGLVSCFHRMVDVLEQLKAWINRFGPCAIIKAADHFHTNGVQKC